MPSHTFSERYAPDYQVQNSYRDDQHEASTLYPLGFHKIAQGFGVSARCAFNCPAVDTQIMAQRRLRGKEPARCDSLRHLQVSVGTHTKTALLPDDLSDTLHPAISLITLN
jgi:hypothetical protein